MKASVVPYSSVVGTGVMIAEDHGPYVAQLAIMVPNPSYDYKETAVPLSETITRLLNDHYAIAGAKDQSELHNVLAGRVVAQIVKPVLERGGEFTSVLVVLESVVMGVMLMAAKLGGDEILLDELVKHVKERLAEERLTPITPEGSA